MPKNPDYSKGIIYKLCCKNPEITDCYIGSTTNFIRRKQQHKNCCNENSNYYVYKFIRDKGGFQNWDMIQIEEYTAKDKKDLESRERYWIETLKVSLNQKIPTRTHKEYRELHKDNILLKKREYYEYNKDNILLKNKEYRKLHKDAIELKDKEYRELHKEIKSLKDKEYRELHKDAIALKNKEKYTCKCGSTLTIIHKIRHEKTQKHQKFILTN